MLKKIISIILFNLIFIFLLFEITCYFYNVKDYKPRPMYSWFKIQSFDKVYEMIKQEKLHQPIGLNYKNRPILLMGCSYAYGYKLNDNEMLGYLLSEKMKRPLFNRAFEWNWGANTMLYQARRKDFYEEVPNPEYVIYIYTSDHTEKVNCSCYDPVFPYPQIRYVMRNGHLEREKFPFRYNLHIFRTLTVRRLYSNIMNPYRHSQEEIDNTINEFFIETKQEFDRHWKNYKFIILVYERGNDYIKANHKNWDELEKQGFTVISTTDLTGRIMNNQDDFISDNYHPSAKAWALIAPKLINRIEKIK